jgi:hypothetical protein
VEFYNTVIALTNSSATTTLGTMAVKVLRLVATGQDVDMEIVRWACYIVADAIGHPSAPDYNEKFLALEAAK